VVHKSRIAFPRYCGVQPTSRRPYLRERDMSTGPLMSEMHWTRPELVAQIRFVEWTAEGRLRHAAFLGLRPDKSARAVCRE
jgi:bifunctional non-homologous end joining protein LigD